MKNDSRITHASTKKNETNLSEEVMEDESVGMMNEAAVSGEVAGKEALRSMEMNTEPKRKASELTSGR